MAKLSANSIGTRLIAGFLLVAFLALGTGVFGYFQIRRVSGIMAQELTERSEARYISTKLRIEALEVHALVNSYVSAASKEIGIRSATRFADKTYILNEFIRQMESHFHGYPLPAGREQAIWSEIVPLSYAYLEQARTVMRIFGQQGLDGAQTQASLNRFEEIRGKLLENLIEFEGEETGLLYASQQRARDSIAQALVMTLGLSALVLVGGAILGLLISRGITRPVDHLVAVAQRITAGDLEGVAKGGGPCEMGVLAKAFNAMTARLRDLVGSLERNVAELLRAKSEQESLVAELEARNAELARFTYTVSHDLKSPLITIKGFMGYLAKDARSGNLEGLEEDIASISNAADKMQALLKDLLELSRIGRLMNPLEEVAFGELACEAVELVKGRLLEREVDLDIAPDLPTVFGDRARLREVVQNLVDNAVKFLGDQPKPRIEIGMRRDGDETVFFVRDNGMGIAPAYQQKVFGLFEKLDPASDGSGMGLAIVKRIVEVHGGRIWAESEGPGKGAAFCFTLPGNRGIATEERKP